MANTDARIAYRTGRTNTATHAGRTEDPAVADRHVATHIGSLAVDAACVDTRTEPVATGAASRAMSSFDFPADAFLVAMCIETMVACAARLASRTGRIARSTGDSDRPTAESATSADNGGSSDDDFATSDENVGMRDAHSVMRTEAMDSGFNSSLTGAGRVCRLPPTTTAQLQRRTS